MVAKKNAAQKTASSGSTGAAAGRKSPAKRSAAGKEAEGAGEGTREPAARKTAAKKASAKKSAAKKASKKAAPAAEEAAAAAGKTGDHTVAAKKSVARSRTAGTDTAPVPPARGAVPGELAVRPGELAVRPGEDPWTPEEVAEARAELSSEALRLSSELEAAGIALAGLMRDSGDGAGDDEADTGTKNITREHEMQLAANAREMLDQTERALARLDAGTYGLCEICGNPIGKARMQAFPRATLCVEDKQKQERRG
ncbi:TraR/DksA family transcriptional regulator [Streptomyces sp. NPDC057499]|uniref:TraR/DksA family transcriptional regulator n=1 Tax=Streptomyces sp. NPDC057499 TaxID=3346150 RepID=UPI0036777C26